MKATLGRRAFIPSRLLGRNMIRQAQSALTFTETVTSRVAAILSKEIDLDDDDVAIEDFDTDVTIRKVTVNEYRECRGGVSLPRAWAVNNLDLDWTDNTVFPMHGISLGRGPSPRDDKQREFFYDLLRQCGGRNKSTDILANAMTGAGKSMAGIWLGHQLKTRTLIVVDSNKIANGWLKNLTKAYGADFVHKYVGRIQQERCEWEDKVFSIALVQSLTSGRRYPHEMYSGFGLVLFDEVQIYGSPTYNKAMSLFPARIRVGLTAENRSGSFGRMIKSHLGDTKVESKQTVLQAQAFLIKNKIEQTFYCMSDGAITTGLSRLPDRNDKIAKLIKRRGYDRGRNVLVLSDRTAQLFELFKRCRALGIPESAMGLHMGTYQTDRFVVNYSYSQEGNKQRLIVEENAQLARARIRALNRGDYSGVELSKALYNRLQRGESVMWGLSREIYEPSQAELDNITNSCQIIFATYQIFSKGVDVPRLDMGVEALPSGNLKQPLGRILRLHEGKPEPEWYAICDKVELEGPFKNASDAAAGLINTFLQGKTSTRIKALRKAKAKIIRA